MRKKGFSVSVHLLSQSQPILYNDVENAYVKEGLYCILKNGIVDKFPLINIFRIKEEYK